MPTDPLTTDWNPDQVEVMNRLRDWSVSFAELNRHLSAWMRLPTSDADALGQITWAAEADAPLSPAQLSRRLGMSSGATSILLNRLEAAGHITRRRVSADQRRVSLYPVPAARAQTHAFLGVAGVEIADVLSGAGPEELRVTAAFLARMTAACVAGNRRLHDTARRG